MKLFKRIQWMLTLPFLVAVYPVLQIFADNQNQLPFRQLVGPIFVSVLITAILFAIFRGLLHSTIKAAAATGVAMADSLFYLLWYSRYQKSIESLGALSSKLSSSALFVGLVVAVTVGIIVLVWRTHHSLRRPAELAAVIMTALIVYTLFNILHYNLANRQIDQLPNNSPLANATATVPAGPPDVYYIILDRYADNKTLAEQYHFDNRAFTNYLKSENFTVADSYANYPFTIQSLASSLNGSYLPSLTASQQKQVSSDLLLTKMVQSSGAAAFFKNHGYQYIHLGSWWDPTGFDGRADINLRFGRGITLFGHQFLVTDFGAVMLRQSLLAPILDKKLIIFGKTVFATTLSANKLHASNGLYELDQLEDNVSRMPGPKFVFAHILLPHPPFVLKPDGSPAAETDQASDNGYVDQMKFTNSQLQKLVASIKSGSANPPVIVLQADEGPYPARFDGHTDTFNWNQATPAELQQKTGILNAYYLPGVDASVLPSTISPVNTFREIINHYFGGSLPILPDNHYIDNSWTPYKFLEVTGQPGDLQVKK